MGFKQLISSRSIVIGQHAPRDQLFTDGAICGCLIFRNQTVALVPVSSLNFLKLRLDWNSDRPSMSHEKEAFRTCPTDSKINYSQIIYIFDSEVF